MGSWFIVLRCPVFLLILTFCWLGLGTLARDADPFKILGLQKGASESQVKQAYRQLAKK